MSYTRSLVIVALLVMIALILGCSGGGTPITPDKSPESLDSVPIIGLTDTNDTFNAIGLMGAYELYINPDDLSAELVNKRVSSIGEDYIVSGIAFFTVVPCADCLKIAGIGLVGGNLQLSFVISHPFKPAVGPDPSAANRNDLDVFDLAMVIFPGGDPAPTPTTYTLTTADVYNGFCVGADGYTCELADVVLNDAALPYFLVVDDSAEVPPAATWNKFAMGTVDTVFDVGFNMLAGSLRFDMYLTMGYGFSAKKPDRITPKYYNPEFNRKAAWKVVVTPPCGVDPPAMGNTWQDNDITTPFDVTVDVYDWQIGAVVSTAADFSDADPGEIYAASSPSGVSVEVPGMNVALNTAAAPDVPTATGMPDDPWVYTFSIPNQNGLAAGDYLGLVKVTDERPVLTPADGRDFLIDTVNGVDLVHFSMPEYATYQTFPATVVVGCGPLTLDSLAGCPTATISNGAVINFVVAAHSDNGGDPVAYEVDTSYVVGDGFIPDPLYPQNSTGIFDVTILDDPCVIGTHHIIAFRITDSCTPMNVLITDVCDIEIGACACVTHNDVLTYDFAGCTTGGADSCQGWTTSFANTGLDGCNLPNTAGWGNWQWGCNEFESCGEVTYPYLHLGYDHPSEGYGTCQYGTDLQSGDRWVVSPVITIPECDDMAEDVTFGFSYCVGTTNYLTVYIKDDGICSSSPSAWTLINTPSTTGCVAATPFDISSYSGSDVIFAFRWNGSGSTSGATACGSHAGALVDNIVLDGNFCVSQGEHMTD